MALQIIISDTCDIAQARQVLRRLATEQAWPNILRVRSIAALTALAEVLYFGHASHQQISLEIHVVTVNEDGIKGIEFYARTDFRAVCSHYLTARWQLERASDEVIIQPLDNSDVVTLRLWTAEART